MAPPTSKLPTHPPEEGVTGGRARDQWHRFSTSEPLPSPIYNLLPTRYGGRERRRLRLRLSRPKAVPAGFGLRLRGWGRIFWKGSRGPGAQASRLWKPLAPSPKCFYWLPEWRSSWVRRCRSPQRASRPQNWWMWAGTAKDTWAGNSSSACQRITIMFSPG